MKPAAISSTDQAGGLMLLTFGNVRFHPTDDICSDTPRGPSWARLRTCQLFQFYVDLLLDDDRECERKS